MIFIAPGLQRLAECNIELNKLSLYQMMNNEIILTDFQSNRIIFVTARQKRLASSFIVEAGGDKFSNCGHENHKYNRNSLTCLFVHICDNQLIWWYWLAPLLPHQCLPIL